MTSGVRDLAWAMVALERRAEVAATNLANASTDGFRRLVVVASSGPPAALLREEGGRLAQLGDLAGPPSGLADAVDLRPGPLETTGNPLDLAIDGPGWFLVLTPQGIAYRRTGSFHVGPDGMVVDPQGHALLAAGGPQGAGPLRVPSGSRVQVVQDGTVTADGSPVGQVRIVLSPGGQDLLPGGGGVYYGPPGTGPAASGSRVLSGVLEGSNVSVLRELVSLIETERAYQSAQQAVQVWDGVSGLAAREVGQVS